MSISLFFKINNKSVKFSEKNDIFEIPTRYELLRFRLWYSKLEIDIMKRKAKFLINDKFNRVCDDINDNIILD